MILDNFRVKLYKEARVWRNEGVISATQFQQLAERYEFNQLDTSATVNYVFIIIALGSVLIGLGAIAFITANWQIWTREIKLLLLLTVLFITNSIGFYLWQQPIIDALEGKKPRQRKQILGQGLLLLGALVLGVINAVMLQVFHINSSNYELFLAWGTGVVIMAYSLRLTSLAILGLILVQLGYFTGLSNLPYLSNDVNLARLAVEHMPLLLWVVFIPLAYLCKSRWVFALSAIAFTFSLQLNLNPFKYLYTASFAFALPPALLWSYDDLLFPNLNFRPFQPLARSLTLLYFCTLFYTFSFRGYWQLNFTSLPTSVVVTNIGCLSIIALIQWLFKTQAYKQSRRFNSMTLVILSWIAIAALIPVLRLNKDELVNVALFNAITAIIACCLIRQALENGERWRFWGGIVLLTLQILSRIIEYNTPLLFKSLVFTGCGIIIIFAGLWFEQLLLHHPSKHSS